MRIKRVLTAQAALERNPDGGASTGRSPNSSRSDSTVPTRADGKRRRACRQYTTSVVSDGTMQSAYATAGREIGGTRRIQS
jgi:surface antigen